MYLSTTRSSDSSSLPRAARGGLARVSGTVVALGSVSLLTDISSEMVTAALPLYVVYGLSLSYLQLGALDSLYTAATAVLRLVGGWVADRWRRPKAVALAGYGTSAATKALLPLAGASLPLLSGVIALDRAGKGVRTGPRDALIADASSPESLGRSFGVHRAMDTCGAMLGPLVTFGLLWLLPGDYTSVFVVSLGFAVVGVVVLAVAVPAARRESTDLRYAAQPRPRAALALLRGGDVRRLVVAAAVLGACTVGDLLLFLAVQQRVGLQPVYLILLPTVSSLAFMAAAVPVGRLADRVGRWRLYLAAHLALVLALVLLATGLRGWPVALVALALHGIFYAASDGVLMAAAAPLVPDHLRATGLATVQTAQVLARSAGALTFGALAVLVDLRASLLVFAAALTLAVAVVARWCSPAATAHTTETAVPEGAE